MARPAVLDGKDQVVKKASVQRLHVYRQLRARKIGSVARGGHLKRHRYLLADAEIAAVLRGDAKAYLSRAGSRGVPRILLLLCT